MGIFRRKPKVKTYNKTTTIIIEVVVALVVLLAGIGIKWLISNRDENSGKLKLDNQVVDKINFIDFTYDEGTKEYTVNAVNYEIAAVTISEFKIYFYSSDNSQVAVATLPGVTLEYNQSYLLKGVLDTNATIKNVEYKVEFAN